MDCSTDKNKLQIITKVPFLHNTFSSISHFGLPQVFRPNSPEMERLRTSPLLTKIPPCLPRLSLQLYQKISCQVHKVLMPEDSLASSNGSCIETTDSADYTEKKIPKRKRQNVSSYLKAYATPAMLTSSIEECFLHFLT